MPRIYISGRPSLHIRDTFKAKTGGNDLFPLDQKRCHFVFSARYALAAGLEALGVGPGDALLIPSYNCGVEIDPILHLGIKPVFYRIGRDLLADCDDLIRKVSPYVKAILITHYLGFPQAVGQIRKICDERKLFLIEDCAHALLSSTNGRYLGSYGDLAVFSLLKTLPVPNGGMFIFNGKEGIYSNCSVKPNLFSTLFYATEILGRTSSNLNNSIEESILRVFKTSIYGCIGFIRLFLIGFRKYLNPTGLYLVRPDSYLFIKDLRSWGISGLSRNILSRTNFREIKIIRRRNFEYLLNHFLKKERGILPFMELPPGVCPLFFPIILENAEMRERIYSSLKERGIISHPWWDKFHSEVPWDEFPDAVYLKKRLFGLPIHQDLTHKHLDFIIEEFEKAY